MDMKTTQPINITCGEFIDLIGHYQLINTLNAKLNPICHLLALLKAHHILHVSGLRRKCNRKLD
jgi:hypothetical protein